MIRAFLDLWWLIDFAVCLVIFQLGRWYEHDRAWIAGRNALRREQQRVRASIDRGDSVIRFPAPASIDEVDDYMAYARARHPSLYDREEAE